jgi:hypothetical protein
MRTEIAEKDRLLRAAVERLHELRTHVQATREQERELQRKLGALVDRRQVQALQDQLKSANATVLQAQRAAEAIDELMRLDRAHPAPDPEALEKLEDIYAKAMQLRADLDASAIILTIVADAGRQRLCWRSTARRPPTVMRFDTRSAVARRSPFQVGAGWS